MFSSADPSPRNKMLLFACTNGMMQHNISVTNSHFNLCGFPIGRIIDRSTLSNVADKLSRISTKLDLTSGFNNVEVTAGLDRSNFVGINGAKAQHNAFRKEWEERA